MINRLLWSLIVAYVYTECIFATPYLTPMVQRKNEYRDLNVSDSRNINIFRKALKSLGEDPTGITLQSLAVRDLFVRSLYLAQYSKDLGFECTFRFSVGLITRMRVIAPKCSTIATVTPSLTLMTTVATTPAPSSVATHHTIEPNYKVDDNDASPDTVLLPGNEPEVLESVKKADSSAGFPDTNKVHETNSLKETKEQDSVLNTSGNDSSRTYTVTKVPVSANGNFEIGSSKLEMVSKPSKRAPVGEKFSSLCFDGSLFLKIDGKWTPSDEGC